jgi:hypothetical protein
VHKGSHIPRCIGNIAIEWNGMTLVGFENHGGRTYLGTAKPLGKVLKGYGNNAEDHFEGAVYRNTYGTYMHGSLLPKNPHFADYLLELALRRKYSSRPSELYWSEEPEITPLNGYKELQTDLEHNTTSTQQSALATLTSSTSKDSAAFEYLTPLDDALEWEAHAAMLERMGLQHEAITAYNRR